MYCCGVLIKFGWGLISAGFNNNNNERQLKRTFCSSAKPLYARTHSHTYSRSVLEILQSETYTRIFVDVMLPGNIPACLAVTSWGLSPESQCIMGDCAWLRLTSPTIPLAEAATVNMVRPFFPADPGTPMQHLRLRNSAAASTSCIVSRVINCPSKTRCTEYLDYVSGAFSRPLQTSEHFSVGEAHYAHLRVWN